MRAKIEYSRRRGNVRAAGGGRSLAQEVLGFHPASAYKYSGERGACKVAFRAKRSKVEIPRRNLKVNATGSLGFARDEKKTQNRFCSPRLFAERWR